MKRSSAAASPLNRLLFATILMLAFAGSIGLATVWLRHQISAVAQDNKRNQTAIVDVQRRTAEVNAEIAAAVNPEVLLRQNASLHLGLEMPRDHQIVRVDASPEVLLAAKRNADRLTPTLITASFPLPAHH